MNVCIFSAILSFRFHKKADSICKNMGLSKGTFTYGQAHQRRNKKCQNGGHITFQFDVSIASHLSKKPQPLDTLNGQSIQSWGF